VKRGFLVAVLAGCLLGAIATYVGLTASGGKSYMYYLVGPSPGEPVRNELQRAVSRGTECEPTFVGGQLWLKCPRPYTIGQ
jgi:hypothetical protein